MPDAVLVGSIKLYEIIERCTSADVPGFAAYQCPKCHMTAILSYCGTCNRRGIWQPIYKHMPFAATKRTDTATQNWSESNYSAREVEFR